MYYPHCHVAWCANIDIDVLTVHGLVTRRAATACVEDVAVSTVVVK